MTDLAPSPVLYGTPAGGSAPFKVTLHNGNRATVTAERRHPNELAPVITPGAVPYRVTDVDVYRQEDGTWRASVDCASRIIPAGHNTRLLPSIRLAILKAFEDLVEAVATPAALWVAQRNALYRAQHEAYVELGQQPDDDDHQANYDSLGAEIARHLSMQPAATGRRTLIGY